MDRTRKGQQETATFFHPDFLGTLDYEAMGSCRKGEGIPMLRDGETTHGGKVVFSPRGGMLSYGHPMGASGAVQIVENVRQLRGRCAGYQVEGARTALSRVTEGGVHGVQHAACTTHVIVADW